MTNKEAINLLDNLLGMVEDNQNSDYDDALHMAIDALQQPERKKGEWRLFDEPGWYCCSECGAVRRQISFMEYFCPNCGADMRDDFSQHMNPPED